MVVRRSFYLWLAHPESLGSTESQRKKHCPSQSVLWFLFYSYFMNCKISKSHTFVCRCRSDADPAASNTTLMMKLKENRKIGESRFSEVSCKSGLLF